MSKSCPNCSANLVGQSCKLRCPRCHYFESCSDLEPYPSPVDNTPDNGSASLRDSDLRDGNVPNGPTGDPVP